MGNQSSADVSTAQAVHISIPLPLTAERASPNAINLDADGISIGEIYDGQTEGDCVGKQAEAFAAFIVRAVNAHDELVAACQAAIKWSEDVPAPYRDWEFIQLAKAALAKAEVQP